ncbi:hypothetical protein F-M6_0417 [Faustovirus]|nr:hypothetical protein F-M6_0417 [Faustovirus]
MISAESPWVETSKQQKHAKYALHAATKGGFDVITDNIIDALIFL